ncbi:hypothetical protein DFJ73DRAFT_848180 [Zopfochytrium polystomum]|nr:hypothetical protein DFJ73DRAFT_848180 [Zopfochytrium polystomum]
MSLFRCPPLPSLLAFPLFSQLTRLSSAETVFFLFLLCWWPFFFLCFRGLLPPAPLSFPFLAHRRLLYFCTFLCPLSLPLSLFFFFYLF